MNVLLDVWHSSDISCWRWSQATQTQVIRCSIMWWLVSFDAVTESVVSLYTYVNISVCLLGQFRCVSRSSGKREILRKKIVIGVDQKILSKCIVKTSWLAIQTHWNGEIVCLLGQFRCGDLQVEVNFIRRKFCKSWLENSFNVHRKLFELVDCYSNKFLEWRKNHVVNSGFRSDVSKCFFVPRDSSNCSWSVSFF